MATEHLALGDYVALIGCYVDFIWPLHCRIGVAGTVAAIVLRFSKREWSAPVLKGSWLFAGLLLLSGLGLNIVWNVTVFSKLYWAYDYAGWECSPFRLIIYGVPMLPAEFYHGMTARSIHGLWVVYAGLSWGSAAWATYGIMKWQRTPGETIRCQKPIGNTKSFASARGMLGLFLSPPSSLRLTPTE